jgi:hypothetical protein
MYRIIQYIFVNNKIYILLQFNALKHQLSTQCYEPSTTAHVVRKLLRRWWLSELLYQLITLFGCFRCLDFRIKNLLFYINVTRGHRSRVCHWLNIKCFNVIAVNAFKNHCVDGQQKKLGLLYHYYLYNRREICTERRITVLSHKQGCARLKERISMHCFLYGPKRSGRFLANHPTGQADTPTSAVGTTVLSGRWRCGERHQLEHVCFRVPDTDILW